MKTIRPIELKMLLDRGQPVDILDIRPRCQFEKAHIEGSHWLRTTHVSPETILFERELLPTEPLYLVSESGALAQLNACELARQGLDNVIVLAGGMHAWEAASLPIVQQDNAGTNSPDHFGSDHSCGCANNSPSRSANSARKITTMGEPQPALSGSI